MLELGRRLRAALRLTDGGIEQAVPVGLRMLQRLAAEFDGQHLGMRQHGRRKRIELANLAVRAIRPGGGGCAVSGLIEINQAGNDGFDVVHQGDSVRLQAANVWEESSTEGTTGISSVKAVKPVKAIYGLYGRYTRYSVQIGSRQPVTFLRLRERLEGIRLQPMTSGKRYAGSFHLRPRIHGAR